MKTNRTIKSIMLLLIALIAAVFIGVGAFGVTKSASADTEVFQMVNSASIRLDGNGLRFKVKMNETVKNTINFNDVNLYFIIMPEKYLTKVNSDYQMAIARTPSGEFDASNSHCLYVKVNNNIYSGGDGYYYANGGVSNVKNANLTESFVGIACIETYSDDTYSYRYADFSDGKSKYPATHLYNIVNRAMLESSEDYYSDIVDCYSWYGQEDYPVYINTQAQYNEFASKINDGHSFGSFNVEIMPDVNVSGAGATELDEGKALPTNTSRYYSVKFYDSKDNSFIREEVVKSGAAATAPTVSPYEDGVGTYMFDKWVDKNQSTVSLSGITQNIQAYTSYTYTVYGIEEITNLNGISGQHKYYKLMNDVSLTDSGAAKIASLDAVLDLNGHTITYTSAASVPNPLIGALNGIIKNGKIVAESTLNGNYSAGGALVVESGAGLVQDVEFNISFTGWLDTGAVRAFGNSLTFDSVVVKASNSVHSDAVGVFYFGLTNTLSPNDYRVKTIALKNSIFITNSIDFSAHTVWGVYNSTLENVVVKSNSGVFASEGAVSGIDYSSFNDNVWRFSPANGFPMILVEENISSLDGISGVSGKYYKLTTDLSLTDSGVAKVASLDSILDLNGHTITYTSARSDMYPLIDALNGAVVNGKIVANSTLNGNYTAGVAFVAQSGSGTVKNVEFDISFTGWLDTQVVRAFGPSITFDTVVIKATNSTTDPRVGLFYYEFATPATVFKNTIIISTMPFGSYGIWGVPSTSIAADTNVTNSGMFASAGAVSGIDYSAFDSNLWKFNPVTGIPMIANVESIDSLDGISGVSGKYYKLTTDLSLTDSGVAKVASLDSILDLNGHTITYTSARSDIKPLIGALNGSIMNGKIVANSTRNGQYSTGAIVAESGSGTVRNVEFDISFTGWLDYNTGWATVFPTTLNFDTVVIKATNSVNSTYVGLFCYEFATPATVFKNTIIISTIEFGAYGSWGVPATSIASDANATNSGMFASAGAVSGIDYSAFDDSIWQINPVTGIPMIANVESIDSLDGISGVSGKYYKLTTDLSLTDSGVAKVASLDSILDLNGHTITYTSARSDIKPLIGTLNGAVVNGKIVANSTRNGQYASSEIVASLGSGTVRNVEFDISFTGWLEYNTGWALAFPTTLNFDTVVIKATNSVDSTYVGLFCYAFDTPATVFNNTIIISTIAFGTYGSWGVPATSIASDANATNSGMFASAGAVSGIDYSAFDDSIWAFDPATGIPMIPESIDSLDGISGVSGKYYKLKTDLSLTDSGAAQVAALNSILDLNGHTITYTSARSDMYPLIGTLNGAIVNGKIVANSTLNGLYSTTGYIVASLGSGTVRNVEFDISFTGWLENNTGWALAFPTTLNFDTVVIKATNSVNSTYVGLFCYAFDTPATVFNNTIIISTIAFGAYGSWGVPATSIASDANATNSGMFASAGAVSGIDYSAFDDSIWDVSGDIPVYGTSGGTIIKREGYIYDAQDLKNISGVGNETFFLANDIAVSDDGSATIGDLNSVLDLNGYAITYTSDRAAVSPLISNINGTVRNGKIVVVSTYSGNFSSCVLITAAGEGVMEQVQIDVDFNGGVMPYNSGWVSLLSTSGKYYDVDVEASNTTDCHQIGVFAFGNVETTVIDRSVNKIEYDNLTFDLDKVALGAYDSWGVMAIEEIIPYVVQNQKAKYKILVSGDDDMTAANELRMFIFNSTGAVLDIVKESFANPNDKFISLGNTRLAAKNAPCSADVLGKEGYIIKTVGKNIYINGCTNTAVLWGVYGYLERALGFDVYYPQSYDYDVTDYLTVENYNVVDVPDIETRVSSYGAIQYSTDMNKMRYTYESDNFIWGVHNTLAVLPPETYQSAHYRWYSNQVSDGVPKELCFTARGNNSEYSAMVNEVANLMYAAFMEPENLDKEYIFFFQMDSNSSWCTCSACRSYTNKITTIARFVNSVAAILESKLYYAGDARYSTFRIAIAAYMQTCDVPAVSSMPHGMIYYCPYLALELGIDEFDRDPDNNNRYFESRLAALSAICPVMFWGYDAVIFDYLLPYDSVHAYQRLYQCLADYNVVYAMVQGVSYSVPETGWSYYKAYLHSKLAWDVDADVDALTEKFFKNMYGSEWQNVLSVFNDTHTLMTAQRWNNMYKPYPYDEGGWTNRITADSCWPEATLRDYINRLNSSVTALNNAGKTEQAKHVKAELVSYLHIYLELYTTAYTHDFAQEFISITSELDFVMMSEGDTDYSQFNALITKYSAM